MDDMSAVEPSGPPGRCVLCQRILSSEIEASGDLEAISLCVYCKYAVSTSGSIGITPGRHMQLMVSDHGNQSGGSRHWRRGLSDSESNGFDSVYGDGDVFSYAAYGGDLDSDSDASVVVASFLDNDMSSHPDPDSDIDSLHAGLNQWNSDDDLEVVESDENTLGNLVSRVRLHRSLATNGRNLPVDWLNEIVSPEWRRIHVPNLFGDLEDQETSHFVGNAGDYLDSRGFEELLERLAETDSSRRGAAPAAVSIVKNLEIVVVDEEFDKGFVCVICKDSVCVGSVVNRLPCLHVYHPSCIVPWLSARNTCPLCRYELPTDEKDYEKRRSRSHGFGNQELQEQDVGMNDEDEEDEVTNEGGGGRWWFVAAPLVSVVGIGLVLWFGGGVFGGSWASQRENRSRRWWSLL